MSARQKAARAKRRVHVQHYNTGAADPALPAQAPLAPVPLPQALPTPGADTLTPAPVAAPQPRQPQTQPQLQEQPQSQPQMQQQQQQQWDSNWDDNWEEDNWGQTPADTPRQEQPEDAGHSADVPLQQEPADGDWNDWNENWNDDAAEDPAPAKEEQEWAQEKEWGEEAWNRDPYGKSSANPYGDDTHEQPEPQAYGDQNDGEQSYDPEQHYEPEQQSYEQQHYEPEQESYDPEQPSHDPEQQSGEPEQRPDETEHQSFNPEQQLYEPEQPYEPEQQFDGASREGDAEGHQDAFENQTEQTGLDDQLELPSAYEQGEDFYQQEHVAAYQEHPELQGVYNELEHNAYSELEHNAFEKGPSNPEPTEHATYEPPHAYEQPSAYDQNAYEEHTNPQAEQSGDANLEDEGGALNTQFQYDGQSHTYEEFAIDEGIPLKQESQQEQTTEQVSAYQEPFPGPNHDGQVADHHSEYSLDESHGEHVHGNHFANEWEPSLEITLENTNDFPAQESNLPYPLDDTVPFAHEETAVAEFPEPALAEGTNNFEPLLATSAQTDFPVNQSEQQIGNQAEEDFFGQLNAALEEPQREALYEHEERASEWEDRHDFESESGQPHHQWNPSNDDLVIYTRKESARPYSDGQNLISENEHSNEPQEYPQQYEALPPDHQQPEDFAVGQQNESTQIFPEENSKLKALEMLDMDDDLLLDDDFLEDDESDPTEEKEPIAEIEPIVQAEPMEEISQLPVQTSTPIQAFGAQNTLKKKLSFASKYANPSGTNYARNQYEPRVPASAPIPSATTTLTDEMKKTLEAARKKNDAYDLPMNLMPQKPKPASRAVSHPQVPNTPHSHLHNPATTGQVPVGPPRSSTSTSNVSSTTSKKAFFEDLPVPTPAKVHRPKAAAAASTSTATAQTHVPPQLSQPPANNRPATNPYAKLTPKMTNNMPVNNAGALAPTPSIVATGNRYQPPQAPTPPKAPSVQGKEAFPQGYAPSQGVLAPQGMVPPQGRHPQGMVPPQGIHAQGVPPQGMVPPQGSAPQQVVPPQNVQPHGAVSHIQGGGQPKFSSEHLHSNVYGAENSTPAKQNPYQPNPAAMPDNSQQPIGSIAPPKHGIIPPGPVQPIGAAPSQVSAQGMLPPQGLVPPATGPKDEHEHKAVLSPRINVNVPRASGSAVSPYIPNAGPYAPSGQRGHSRTSSIIGGRAKEGNPYAPIAATNGSLNLTPTSNQGHPQKAPIPRNRGKSIGRQLQGRGLTGKIENPMALLDRQFPIFHWSASSNVAYLIPGVSTGFGIVSRAVKVEKSSNLIRKFDIYNEFPGPLSKSKSKKKEIEAWLEKNIGILEARQSNDELLLCKVLLALVQHDGLFTSPALHQTVASILNPQVDYSTGQNDQINYMPQVAAPLNASKLDNAGLATVTGMLQVGERENAVNFSISKQDWALALIIAYSIGPEKFAQVSYSYSKVVFPFQKNQNNKTYHLMSIMLRSFGGNSKSLVESFLADKSETEFAKQNYREIIAAALINGLTGEFLVEYGGFLASMGMTGASEIAYMMAGIIMSKAALPSGNVFSMVGAFTQSCVYTEIYEYILQTSVITSNVIPSSGIPHLIEEKIYRAQVLADLGQFSTSRKYCDVINSSLKAVGRSPLVSPQDLAEFQALVVRLSQSSSNESGWLGSKLSKVNLDKVWGQLDKFIGGEEAAPKVNEKGVFSKFSPSISRTTSALDITQIPISLPHQMGGGYAPNAVPPEAGSPSKPQSRPQAPLRYAPVRTNSMMSNTASSTAQQISFSAQNQNGSVNTPSGMGAMLNQGDDPRQQHLKLNGAPPHVQRQLPPRQGVYSNRLGQLSSLSIASGSFPTSSRYAPNSEKRNSIGSVSSVEHGGSDRGAHRPESNYTRSSTRGHSRDSSHEFPDGVPKHHVSELKPGFVPEVLPDTIDETTEPSKEYLAEPTNNFDGPVKQRIEKEVPAETDAAAEKKLAAESQAPLDHAQEVPEKESAPVEHDAKQETVPEPESEPLLNEAQNERHKMDEEDEKKAGEENGHASHENEGAPTKDNVSETIAPPPSLKKAPPPRKSNPYAPGASRAVSKGNNKYGPPGGAMKSQVEGDADAMSLMPDVSYADVFGYKPEPPTQVELVEKEEEPQNAPEVHKQPGYDAAPLNLPKVTAEEVDEKESVQAPGPARNLGAPPKRIPGPPLVSGSGHLKAYAPKKYAPSSAAANIDISYDSEAAEPEYESPIPTKAPLILNTTDSPAPKEFANPYHREETALLPLDRGLEDFSIPGSPEYTTRANSVIGHHGLYSSRLSQSHQTEMYHQYEVKDDTVLDYVPVEEDEEDEEEARLKKEAQRKKEEAMANEKASKQEESAQGHGREGSPTDGSGWFKGWMSNKKGDDKPKPIKAKMGQANTFKYDDKLKRWIDTSRPLEEQLKSAAPPPPPKKKARPEGPAGRLPPAVTNPMTKKDTSDGAESTTAAGGPSRVAGSENTPGSPAGRNKRVPSKAANLATAGLDDLLSYGAPSQGAGPRKSKRRYVNVMDKK